VAHEDTVERIGVVARPLDAIVSAAFVEEQNSARRPRGLPPGKESSSQARASQRSC
jgi:hypothetical protein